jgi:hypothetical protein
MKDAEKGLYFERSLSLRGAAFSLPMSELGPGRVETFFVSHATGRDGRDRIQRTGTCPTGYVGKGNFCEAFHDDTPRAMPNTPSSLKGSWAPMIPILP